MAQHPWGRTIEIFGIESPTNGRSCEEHVICGSVLQDDVVVRLRKVQVVIEDTKRQKRHRNSGCAVAALISPPITSAIPPSPTKSLSKKRKTQQEQDEEKGFNTEDEIRIT